MLAQSHLLPILDYADMCYLEVIEKLLKKLERHQNLAIRFVYDLRQYGHVSQFRTRKTGSLEEISSRDKSIVVNEISKCMFYYV